MQNPQPELESNIIELLEQAYDCRVNDLKKSNSLAKKALALSNGIKNFNFVARSLNQLALVAMIRGENAKAIRYSKEAIRLFNGQGNDKGVADARYNLAGVYYKTDNYHLGLANLVDCLATYEKHKDYHNLARVHKSLGTIYEYFGDAKNAITSYENAISAARKAGDLNLRSNAYNPLSGIYLKLGRIEKAQQLINKSVELKTITGDVRGLAFALYGRGKVNEAKHQYGRAEADFLEALAIHEKMEERLGKGMVLYKLGGLYKQLNRFDDAVKILEEAISFSNDFNIAMIRFKCYYHLYEIHRTANNTEKALYYLENYLKEKEAVINSQSLKIIESYELKAKMNAMQQQAIKEREQAEIIEKKNRAEQAALIKQEFLSTMSHEIRTPLNAVTTITSLLSDKTNAEEKQLIDSLKIAGNNLLLIINDILDFTKLDSGKAVLEQKPVELKALLSNVKSIYEGLAAEKGLEFIVNLDDSLEYSYNIDQTKLMQILGNLTSNAIKFTDDGTVNISAQKLFSDENTDAVRFTVSDTGSGILPIHKEQIFESFFQPFSVTTRRQGGSGLGLAIVKKLVQLHGSTISLNSEPAKGSVFSFDINLEKVSLQPVTVKQSISSLAGKKVLLAEDNMINAMVAMKLLKGWGMITTHAKNGIEAVEKASESTFDYILMDIHMPEMDGFAAAKLIRNNDGNANCKIPLFALTADITANQREEYTKYFNGFLRKPIEINALQSELLSVADIIC